MEILYIHILTDVRFPCGRESKRTSNTSFPSPQGLDLPLRYIARTPAVSMSVHTWKGEENESQKKFTRWLSFLAPPIQELSLFVSVVIIYKL